MCLEAEDDVINKSELMATHESTSITRTIVIRTSLCSMTRRPVAFRQARLPTIVNVADYGTKKRDETGRAVLDAQDREEEIGRKIAGTRISGRTVPREIRPARAELGIQFVKKDGGQTLYPIARARRKGRRQDKHIQGRTVNDRSVPVIMMGTGVMIVGMRTGRRSRMTDERDALATRPCRRGAGDNHEQTGSDANQAFHR